MTAIKGIICAGGYGTRLKPLTSVTNKHLLPVYDKPMIYYPLEKLVEAGVKDILIVTGPENAGDFMRLLGSGKQFGANLFYRVQEEAGGIAQAVALAEQFSDGAKLMVILGDNIFEDNFKQYVEKFKNDDSVYIFLKKVPDPQRFGVAEVDKNGCVLSIEEKPKAPKSNLAAVGIYLYPPNVFDEIRKLKPSGRGELELTDLNVSYLRQKKLKAFELKGFWSDAGTLETLYTASDFLRRKKPFP